jgi:hypothetical protein
MALRSSFLSRVSFLHLSSSPIGPTEHL